MKKRLFSILLMCCMALTLLPTAVFAEGETDVSINETNFPDANFRTVVKEYDIDKDENLSRAEIEAVKEIKCYNKDIRSLTGIEYFTALQTLKCYSNQLTSLDISGNTALKSLDCAKNQLAALDVSQNTALDSLDCADNQLTTLDVSRNTALKSLNCADNQVTSLDISQNTALESLICAGNKLAALNVSGNATLKFLNCESNELTALDVNRNTALNTLNCLNNRLTSLNVSLNLNLQDLNCAKNKLAALDVQKNTALKSLYCGYNQLTVLDVGQNRSLESLSCNNNLLTSLNVSQNTRLNLLHCFNNHLTSLDTSNQKWLHTLSCNNNNYPITITNDRNYDLSDLPGTFDVNKASNWSGGTVSGNILTVDHDKDGVTYTYDCGNGKTANFTLTVENKVEEQFTLTPGGRYYFDLSAMDIPGTANSGNSFGAVSLPDTSLHYVPFIYAGTIEAYKLTSAMATTEEYAQQNKYAHSLFVADYAVTHKVNWNNLDTASLIFGKNYASGGVDYTLRAPSVGSNSTGSGDSQRGVPQSNEWDTMLNKNSGYIQNWNEMYSWGQDAYSTLRRAIRGYNSARTWNDDNATHSYPLLGFRPVLEVLNPDTLGSDGLKVVTLDLGGGKLGNSSEDIQIIVKTGSEFTAPASDGLTRPDGDAGSFFMWLGSNGKFYAPGDSVPAEVTKLTAQWTAPTYAVTLNTNGGTINSGNVTSYTYGVGATLPTADDMTYTGYTFKGWYDNENLTGSPIAAIGDTETGNKEYWAKWEANTYTVTLHTNGGTINSGNVTGYTYGVGATLPTAGDMTYTGHTFVGWYDNENLTGSPVTAIGGTETGNKEYWAKWEINQYTITVKPENGKADITITQDYGTPITAPTLTREGYQFNGWDKTFPTTMPAENLTITAQWRDIAVPTGEIKIAENGWKSFFNTITFGLFFKDTQMVTVTAADNSGEAVKIEYLLSDKALTESELAGMTFTAYSAPFSINPDNEYVIYAKLTDTSGNVAYINTNGIVLDATVPVISGIEAGKTYCAAQTITVDEKYIGTVKVNGTEVILDENGQFILSPASGEQTIVVTDKAGNETRVTVTVNDGHTYEWQSENGQYWQKCKFCNHETAKKDIPTINISGADKVCRTQDYKFSFTLPEGATDAAYGYEFIGLGDGPLTPTVENGLYSGIIKASTYPAKENSFKLIVSAKTADGFEFSAEKAVAIQNEHSGGTATCKDKAICEVCGESYGELDPNNHANLKHIDAKAATKTSEGNIEYWYCDGCNKYYKDAKATQEIKQADTVTAKRPDDSKSPQTGDNSNLALWIALLFVSDGAVTATTVYGRKKKRLTK